MLLRTQFTLRISLVYLSNSIMLGNVYNIIGFKVITFTKLAAAILYLVFWIKIFFVVLLAVKPKMKSHYRGHKMAVWLNLIPQLHQPGDEDVSMRHHHFHEREPHYYAGIYNCNSVHP